MLKHLILNLLEQETGQDLSILRKGLNADLAFDFPVDSLVMVNIVLDIEEQLSITISNSELTSRRLRSLDVFAEFLEQKIANS